MGPVGLQLPGRDFFYLGCSGSNWPDNIEGSGSSTVVLFENVWNFYFLFSQFPTINYSSFLLKFWFVS